MCRLVGKLWSLLSTPRFVNFVNSSQDLQDFLGGFLFGEVSELADEHDLGSCALGRGGSNPPFPTHGFHSVSEALQLLNYPSSWSRVSPSR